MSINIILVTTNILGTTCVDSDTRSNFCKPTTFENLFLRNSMTEVNNTFLYELKIFVKIVFKTY